MAEGLEFETEHKARTGGSPVAVDSESAHSAAVNRYADHHDADPTSTIARCKACGADFGEFYNGWLKVTGSYYLPSRVGTYRITGLHPKGKPKPASADSTLVGW